MFYPFGFILLNSQILARKTVFKAEVSKLSLKSHTVNIQSLQDIGSLLQFLNSAILVRKAAIDNT